MRNKGADKQRRQTYSLKKHSRPVERKLIKTGKQCAHIRVMEQMSTRAETHIQRERDTGCTGTAIRARVRRGEEESESSGESFFC